MNMLTIASKLDDEDWLWVNYILHRFYPKVNWAGPLVPRTKTQLMLVDLDHVKIALRNSTKYASIPRDNKLYEKIYGKPTTQC